MGSPHDRPVSDPLLRPDEGQRDARGRPVRAPLGNSIRTFLVFSVLVIIGAGIWWIRRPDDLSAQLGGREWTITEVDGEPAENEAGTVSTFVLDGTGEVRAVLDCNIVVGEWRYDEGVGLDIDWETQTTVPCPDGWPQTYLPDSGGVTVDGSTLRIDADTVEIRAVALAERESAAFDDVAGTWITGDQSVEIGRRGLFQVDECRGEWTATDDETAMNVVFDEIQPDACSLDPVWVGDAPLVPVLIDGSLYLRRDRPVFPLDREIVRLDAEE